MEYKLKQLERKVESQDKEIHVLRETHEEFLMALNTLQQMCEYDSLEIAKLLKRLDSLNTPTVVHKLNDTLSVL